MKYLVDVTESQAIEIAKLAVLPYVLGGEFDVRYYNNLLQMERWVITADSPLADNSKIAVTITPKLDVFVAMFGQMGHMSMPTYGQHHIQLKFLAWSVYPKI